MKKSELRNIIKEELLKESIGNMQWNIPKIQSNLIPIKIKDGINNELKLNDKRYETPFLSSELRSILKYDGKIRSMPDSLLKTYNKLFKKYINK